MGAGQEIGIAQRLKRKIQLLTTAPLKVWPYKAKKKSGHCWLVEYHHFGDEGLDVSDVCQTTRCRERAKVFFGIAPIIRLMIILRKELQKPFIIWLIAALERIYEDQTPARL